MSLCQVIYDITFCLHFVVQSTLLVESMFTGIGMFGGLSVALWTNVLAFTVLYTIKYRTAYDILKKMPQLQCIVLGPSALLAILCVSFYNDFNSQIWVINAYYVLRWVSIFLNFVALGLLNYRSVHQEKSYVASSNVEKAISAMSKRLIWYPLMQTFCRIPLATYEALYGYTAFPGGVGTEQYALGVMSAFATPSAGICYLIIFLLMQPRALATFLNLLCCNLNAANEVADTTVVINRESGDGRLTMDTEYQNSFSQRQSYLITNEFEDMDDDELLSLIVMDTETTTKDDDEVDDGEVDDDGGLRLSFRTF